jgi:dihydropyrimidinase
MARSEHYDLIIRGGTVVLEGAAPVACDVGIVDGRIGGLLQPGHTSSAKDEIDASGILVLPGVVDAHVHFGLGSPDDWITESRAAALGGVTTILSYLQSANSYREAAVKDRVRGEAESVIDFALHPILMNEVHLDEIPTYVDELGLCSFKYFTNFKGDEGAYMGVAGTDAGFFYDLCRRIAQHPVAVLAVHTENIEIVWRIAAEVRASGRDGLSAWNDSRPDLVEALDASLALMLSERTGARIYLPHVSSAAVLNVYREHRARGGSAYLETCPHYLCLTIDSDAGTLAKVNPPVRTESDREALWRAVSDGTIAVVGSDHNSRPRAKKAGTIWKAAAGFPGVTTLLPLLLQAGHVEREIPIERISEVVSTNPAKIFGLYPCKGAIRIGADADLVLVDPNRPEVIDGSRFGSHSDYSPYDGMAVCGWPVTTIVRGRPVMRDGEILVKPGWGKFIRRPVCDAIEDPTAALISAGAIHRD